MNGTIVEFRSDITKDLGTVDFAKREGYIVLEQLTSHCSLFFFVFWTSIYSW